MTAARKPRTWRWRTMQNPYAPPAAQVKPHSAARIPHPLAHRVGEPVRERCRGSNGNALFEFEDGFRVVAPWRAAL